MGDSPIIGAGQYADNDVGAAGSTGLGELNIMICGAFFTVENMRRGMRPTDAALETCRRAVAAAPARFLNADGTPKFQLDFYAVNKKCTTAPPRASGTAPCSSPTGTRRDGPERLTFPR